MKIMSIFSDQESVTFSNQIKSFSTFQRHQIFNSQLSQIDLHHFSPELSETTELGQIQIQIPSNFLKLLSIKLLRAKNAGKGSELGGGESIDVDPA